jgi:choline transporter
MHNGKLVQIGVPEEIKNRPANDYVKSLFSTADTPNAAQLISQFHQMDPHEQAAVRQALLG